MSLRKIVRARVKLSKRATVGVVGACVRALAHREFVQRRSFEA